MEGIVHQPVTTLNLSARTNVCQDVNVLLTDHTGRDPDVYKQKNVVSLPV